MEVHDYVSTAAQCQSSRNCK